MRRKGLVVVGKSKNPSNTASKYKERDARRAVEDAIAQPTGKKADKAIRRGRPPLGDRVKSVVTIRLDADVLESYRESGAGWQTRINADLRRVRKLKKLRPAGDI